MNIGKCFKDAWGLFTLDLGPLIVTALIASVIMGVASLVLSAAFAGGIAGLWFGGAAWNAFGSASAFVGFVFMSLVVLAVYVWAGSTMFRMVLRRIREQRPADYSDMAQTDRIGVFAVAFVVLGVLVGIGWMLLVVPGLILVTLWVFALPMVADRGIGVVEAMTESKALASRGGYLNTFATWFLGALVVCVIALILNRIPVVGIVVGLLTVPFEITYLLSMYLQATGEDHLIDAAFRAAGR